MSTEHKIYPKIASLLCKSVKLAKKNMEKIMVPDDEFFLKFSGIIKHPYGPNISKFQKNLSSGTIVFSMISVKNFIFSQLFDNKWPVSDTKIMKFY